MTRLDQLPTEITQLICCHIHPSSIVAFSCTCQTLLSQSQVALQRHAYYLLKYHEVNDHSATLLCRTLLDVLREPWLAWYIKRAVFYCDRRDWTPWTGSCAAHGRHFEEFRDPQDSKRDEAENLQLYQLVMKGYIEHSGNLHHQMPMLTKVYSVEDMATLRAAIEAQPSCAYQTNRWMRLLARGGDLICKILLISVAQYLQEVVLPPEPSTDNRDHRDYHCWRAALIDHVPQQLINKDCGGTGCLTSIHSKDEFVYTVKHNRPSSYPETDSTAGETSKANGSELGFSEWVSAIIEGNDQPQTSLSHEDRFSKISLSYCAT